MVLVDSFLGETFTDFANGESRVDNSSRILFSDYMLYAPLVLNLGEVVQSPCSSSLIEVRENKIVSDTRVHDTKNVFVSVKNHLKAKKQLKSDFKLTMSNSFEALSGVDVDDVVDDDMIVKKMRRGGYKGVDSEGFGIDKV